jgi:hypothetical protein
MADDLEENGKIESTHLGLEDHGIFTAWLHLVFDGSGQGFGGFAFGGEFTDWFIREVLRVTGAENWEKIPGRYIRVKRDESRGKIIAIGSVENNPLRARVTGEWFEPRVWKEQKKVTAAT